jgi:beta-glucosidase
VRVRDDYAPRAIVITENGASYFTGPSEDGGVHDDARLRYLRMHLHACADAIADGVPLTGYFAWSLMDNFEWAFGYDQRFGLVWVDYDTLARTPKDSALWYADVARTRGLD